jgi:hypothetical protein
MAKRLHKGPEQVANLLDMYRVVEERANLLTKPVHLIFALIEYFKLPYERASFEAALWLAAKHGLIRIPASVGRPIGGRVGRVSKEALKKRRQRDVKTWPEGRQEEFMKALQSGAAMQLIEILTEIDWHTRRAKGGTK